MTIGSYIAAGIVLLAGGFLVVVMLRVIWAERPRYRKDLSCPDCGRDPHLPACRFAWMGPPPTEFIFLALDPDETQPIEQRIEQAEADIARGDVTTLDEMAEVMEERRSRGD